MSVPYDVDIKELKPFGLINVRGDEDARLSFSKILNADLLMRHGQIERQDGVVVFRIGPDEWIVRVTDGDERKLAERLNKAVAAEHAAVTIVSDAYRIFKVIGRDIHMILSQATGLDLSDDAFGPGSATVGQFAKTRALYHRLDKRN